MTRSVAGKADGEWRVVTSQFLLWLFEECKKGGLGRLGWFRSPGIWSRCLAPGTTRAAPQFRWRGRAAAEAATTNQTSGWRILRLQIEISEGEIESRCAATAESGSIRDEINS
jgi:hypothetical protein